jgi:hypothetical protein
MKDMKEVRDGFYYECLSDVRGYVQILNEYIVNWWDLDLNRRSKEYYVYESNFTYNRIHDKKIVDRLKIDLL